MSKSISLVLSGYYGYDNVGDEAILFAILQQLKAVGITPVVLSGNPAKTTEMYGVKAVHRMKVKEVCKAVQESDGLISGGGSLLQDTTSARSAFYYLGVMKIAQWFKKPVFCYAQGVGPLRRKWIHPFARSVLSHCEFISVRDAYSERLVKQIGVKHPIELTADPVLGLKVDSVSFADEKLDRFLQKRPLILCVRNWESEEKVCQEMGRVIDRLRKEEIPILLLPFHSPYDVTLANRLKESVQFDEDVFVAENVKDINDFVYIIKNGYVVVGMRLHALVFAASQVIPFVGISYDPKIDSFMELFNLESATSTEEWNTEAIMEKILWIYEHYDEEVNNIEEQLETLMEKGERPIQYITNFFKEDVKDNSIRNTSFSASQQQDQRNIK